MEKIVWSDKFITGIEEIDSQHKLIFMTINELIDSVETSDEESYSRLVSKLIKVSIHHLSFEEDMMIDHDYPGYDAHLESHTRYRATMTEMLPGRHSQNENLKMMEIVKDWWVNHVLEEDMGYRPFLEDRG